MLVWCNYSCLQSTVGRTCQQSDLGDALCVLVNNLKTSLLQCSPSSCGLWFLPKKSVCGWSPFCRNWTSASGSSFRKSKRITVTIPSDTLVVLWAWRDTLNTHVCLWLRCQCQHANTEVLSSLFMCKDKQNEWNEMKLWKAIKGLMDVDTVTERTHFF